MERCHCLQEASVHPMTPTLVVFHARYMWAVDVAFARTNSSLGVAEQGELAPPSSPAAAALVGQWRHLVDEQSFVDYHLGTEVTKNPDGYRGSVYFSKERARKLQLGPMWDYNEAFGLCCGGCGQRWGEALKP